MRLASPASLFKLRPMPVESVLVVARESLFGGTWPQGFEPVDPASIARIEREARFLPREFAERSPQWKQPIPYCVVERGEAWFCVERLAAQGEARLHGRRSIGLGGHIGPEDALHPEGPVRSALLRELREELDLGPGPGRTPQFLGLLNDDSTEVGRVHFGLVFRLTVAPEENVAVRESLKMRGGWGRLAGPGGLWQDLDRFETWSRILLEARAAGHFAPYSGTGPVASQVQGDQLDRSEEATDG